MLELTTVSLLNGVVYGLLLFMLTSGLTLIFSMMGVLNFAHASVFMLGAYFSYQLGRWIGFWPALVIAPLLCGLVGAGIERYGLRHVHKSGHVAEILFTFGLAYLIEELVTMIWGRNVVANSVPQVIDFPLFELFGSSFPAYKGLMMTISVAMFVFLYLALKRTRIGLIIQAALTHPQMVGALGHDVPGVFVLVFAVGSALAGLAGVIGGFMLLTQPTLAHAVGPIVFVVVVVGGLGSLAGALTASMLIGILQTFAVAVDYSMLD
ncbi:MAG: branched-chain amino acid ABC transporter permease, partial [Betaproteobacteria bacterium]